ncbi:MAG: hypothetical protein ABIK85_02955 [Candidatus Eisenbacteria bacterium]
MLPKKQHEAFSEFCDAAYGDDALGPRMTLMLKLATAMVLGCYP